MDVDQQENDLKVGMFPGDEGFGQDSPADFGQLTYFNQNGDRIVKHIPTVAGDYGRVYDSAYESIINGADKLVSDEQILAVIKTLENGFLNNNKKTYQLISLFLLTAYFSYWLFVIY